MTSHHMASRPKYRQATVKRCQEFGREHTFPFAIYAAEMTSGAFVRPYRPTRAGLVRGARSVPKGKGPPAPSCLWLRHLRGHGRGPRSRSASLRPAGVAWLLSSRSVPPTATCIYTTNATPDASAARRGARAALTPDPDPALAGRRSSTAAAAAPARVAPRRSPG
eukprot:scaffold439_cov415-Prasinococcus_capsulatus_cf.AAC.21